MGRRLAARVIDATILGVAFSLFFGAFLGILAATTGRIDLTKLSPAALIVLLVLVYLIMPLGAILYEALFIALRGETPGKRIVGVKVVRLDTYEPIGTGPGFLRWLIPWAAGSVLFGLGALVVYLSPFLDKTRRNRGWHDTIAGDLVVRGR